MDWALVIGVAIGWLATLTGVITGGYIGYRAKHGGYEPFIKPRVRPEDTAFNLEDDLDKLFPPTEGFEEPIRQPDIVKRMQARFMNQAAEDLGVNNAV